MNLTHSLRWMARSGWGGHSRQTVARGAKLRSHLRMHARKLRCYCRRGMVTLTLMACCLGAEAAPAQKASGAGPGNTFIRGLHLAAPGKKDFAALVRFVRESLHQERVNTLVLEFDYNFDFQSRSEFANASAPGKTEARQLVEACREVGIDLVPQINCLGHQSWAERTGPFLKKHPEFDESPGKDPTNKNIYCRSYCPLHPDVHSVLFDLMDELVRNFEAKSFHVGMDEVFILADPDCPRCKGKRPAELFAGEVRTLHDHLRQIGCRMWMWGDRFINAKSTRLGKWEASENGTDAAIEQVPKDILICDWHYDNAPQTLEFFTGKGFEVVACPWRKPAVALAQLAQIESLRGGADSTAPSLARGLVQTTWCGFGPFAQACRNQQTGAAPEKNSASEAAHCFLTLFKTLREKQL